MRYQASVEHTQVGESYPMETFDNPEAAQHYIYQQAYACVASENGRMETSADENTIRRYNRKKELVSVFRVTSESAQD